MSFNYTALGLQKAAEHLAVSTADPSIRTRITAAGRVVESLDRFAKTRNPTVTPDAHSLKVEAKAKTATADMARIFEGFNEALRRRVIELDTSINEATNFRANEQAAEIRAAIRGMPEKERLKAVLAMAADRNSGPVLAALSGQPAFLTGLQPDFSSKIITAFQFKHAPEQVAERDALVDKTFASAHGLFGKIEHYIKQLPGDTSEIREGIERATQAEEAYSTASALAN